MWQIRVLLGAALLICTTDAFFLNWFKKSNPQPHSAPSYHQQQQQYSYYSPPAYKVPVWQAMPSGYSAYPVQQQQYQQQGSSYAYQAPVQQPSYSAPAPPAYNEPVYSEPAQPAYSAPAPAQASYSYPDAGVSYGGAPAPVVAPPAAAPAYPYDTATYSGNVASDAGGSTLVSVPVYFPKQETGSAGLSGSVAVNSAPSYSNGVSGFYDGSASENFLTLMPAPKS